MFSDRHTFGLFAFVGLILAAGCGDMPPEADRQTPSSPSTPINPETGAENRLDPLGDREPLSGSSDERLQLADSLARQRLFDQAAPYYSSLLESDPDNTDVLLKRATAWLHLERFEAANADLDRAIAIDPGNGKARLLLAKVLHLTDRPQDAILQLEQALAMDLPASERLLAHRNVAALLQESDRDDEALRHLDTAMSLAPINVELQRDLARLLASSPNDEVRDGDRALVLAEELFGHDRSLSNAEILAMALAAAGRFEEAANWQRRLIAEAARFGHLDELPRLRQAQNHYKERRPAIGVPMGRQSRSANTE